MSSRRNHLSSRCVWLAHFLFRRAQVHVSFLIACFYCNHLQNVLFNPSNFHFVTPALFLPVLLELCIPYGHLEFPNIYLYTLVFYGRHAFDCLWTGIKCVLG